MSRLCDQCIVMMFAIVFSWFIASGETVVWNEPYCLQNGGICMRVDECRDGDETERGLCPKQQKDGIECCYGLPNNDGKLCEKSGGACRTRPGCHENIQISETIDCGPNEVCCALV